MDNKNQNIIVIYGGNSAEREVSLNSGKAVISSLTNQGYNVKPVDGVEELLKLDDLNSYDAVFNILHGEAGENGQLASLLTLLNIKYTGCDCKGAILSWHKDIAKKLVTQAGLLTPSSVVQTKNSSINISGNGPWIVKPTQEGSSVGLYFEDDKNKLEKTIDQALSTVDSVLVEEFIDGVECTVAIVDNIVLPVVKIIPNNGLYDYEAKYESAETGYYCPSGFSSELESMLKQDATTAYQTLGLKGWARVDFIVDENNNCWFLEANTTPGMTKTSLVPKAAKSFGWSFDQLVSKILGSAFEEASHV